MQGKAIVGVLFGMVLLALFSLSSPANGADDSELDRLQEEGAQAFYMSKYREALAKWEKGLELSRQTGNKSAMGAFIGNIGVVYGNLGQYEKALSYYEQALANKREIGDRAGERAGFSNIGLLYESLGRYEKALSYYGQALAIDREMGDRGGVGADLCNIGVVYADLGRYEKALTYFEQALPIRREVGDKRGEGADLTNIGLVYRSLGQYEKALSYCDQALAIKRDIKDKRGEGGDLGNMGVMYSNLGQHEKALSYYNQALEIKREIGDERGEGNNLGNIGLEYAELGLHEKALSYYEQALAIYREIGDRKGQSNILTNIGVVYGNLGRHEKALSYYEQALAIDREIGDRSGEGGDLINVGVVYTRLGQHEKARSSMSESLAICLQVGAPEPIWRARRGLAAAEARAGAYAEAISHYEQSLDTIELMRSGLTEKEVKASFMEDKLYVYDELISLLASLHAKDPSRGYDSKSFEIFERKQGRIFLEEMGKSGARHFAGLPDTIRSREDEGSDKLGKMLSSLAEEKSRPADSSGSQLLQQLEAGIRQVRADQEALQEEIRTRYPDYHALRYPKPATLEDLRSKIIEPREAVLIYGAMSSSTCLWVITNKELAFFQLSQGEHDLQERINAFRNGPQAVLSVIMKAAAEGNDGNVAGRLIRSAARDTEASFHRSSHELYGLLLPEGARKLIESSTTLYIIPTGPLYALPFEALIASNSEEDKEPRYLVEDHAIVYLSSASLLKTLRESKARRKEQAKYPLLAFANPVYAKAKPGSAVEGGTASFATGSDPAGPPKAIAVEASKAGNHAAPIPRVGLVQGSSAFASMRTRAYLEIMGGSFPELPDTEDEAKEIRDILEAPEESRPLHLREAASRSTVFRLNEEDKLEDYRYLLFSCHGIAPDELNPLAQPALVLSLPDPKTGQDDFLTMADVFSLKLNADMVTLSACNTARGKVQKGEGVMGLTRAFMYAGAPAISVALWSVESSSARLLSTGLFTGLKAGKSRAEALREIKLSMLRGEKGDIYRHPFFWAPLVIFGDGN